MECDVIVVGAGVSGLATADQLAPERPVIVLEADSRVGGRLRSVDGLDLGASWFWPGEHRVATLVDELNIPTHPQYLDGDALHEAPDGVVRLDGNPIDVPSARFSRGADDLTAALRRRLGGRCGSDLWLDSHVQAIEWDGAGDRPLTVTVTPATGDHARTIRASHVVLAVPPALAAATIEFRPSLGELHELAMGTPVWMGTTTKAVARYATTFWRDAGLSGSAISHLGPLGEIHDLSGPGGRPAALFGFAPTTARSSNDGAAVLAQLVRLFGPSAADPLELHLADWRRAPLTSPVGTADSTDYSTYGDPRYHRPAFGGRLHWSSTETSAVAPGHIEGALAAAERTVEAIRTASAPPHQETP
jgi:monoamine oxidase